MKIHELKQQKRFFRCNPDKSPQVRWKDPENHIAFDPNEKYLGIFLKDLFVIDLDFHKHEFAPALVSFYQRHADIFNDCYKVRTMNGGMHIYFAIPPGLDIKQYTFKKLNGMDLKYDDMGYVLFPTPASQYSSTSNENEDLKSVTLILPFIIEEKQTSNISTSTLDTQKPQIPQIPQTPQVTPAINSNVSTSFLDFIAECRLKQENKKIIEEGSRNTTLVKIAGDLFNFDILTIENLSYIANKYCANPHTINQKELVAMIDQSKKWKKAEMPTIEEIKTAADESKHIDDRYEKILDAVLYGLDTSIFLLLKDETQAKFAYVNNDFFMIENGAYIEVEDIEYELSEYLDSLTNKVIKLAVANMFSETKINKIKNKMNSCIRFFFRSKEKIKSLCTELNENVSDFDLFDRNGNKLIFDPAEKKFKISNIEKTIGQRTDFDLKKLNSIKLVDIKTEKDIFDFIQQLTPNFAKLVNNLFMAKDGGVDYHSLAFYIQNLGRAIFKTKKHIPGIFGFIGPGAQGKTTFNSIISKVAKSSFTSFVFNTADNFLFESAIKSTILNVTESFKIDNENVSLLKALTGEAAILVRRKYKTPVTMIGNKIVLIDTNVNIINAYFDESIKRRLFVVESICCIDNKDSMLLEKIKAELPLIISLFLSASIANDFIIGTLINDAREDKKEDDLAEFISEYIEFTSDKNDFISSDEVFNLYERFCLEKNLSNHLKRKSLISILKHEYYIGGLSFGGYYDRKNGKRGFLCMKAKNRGSSFFNDINPTKNHEPIQPIQPIISIQTQEQQNNEKGGGEMKNKNREKELEDELKKLREQFAALKESMEKQKNEIMKQFEKSDSNKPKDCFDEFLK